MASREPRSLGRTEGAGSYYDHHVCELAEHGGVAAREEAELRRGGRRLGGESDGTTNATVDRTGTTWNPQHQQDHRQGGVGLEGARGYP